MYFRSVKLEKMVLRKSETKLIYLWFNARCKLNSHVQFCDTDLFQKSVVNMGIKLHNKVPESVKKLDNFKIFKKELKSLLLSHFFYLVDRVLQFSLKLVCKVFLSASSD